MFGNKSMTVFSQVRNGVRLVYTKSKSEMSKEVLKDIFLKSVASVQPQKLIKNELKLTGRHLVVRGETYQLRKPCYVVGFGKAVLGMAIEVERVLEDQLERGVVVVPTGIFKNGEKPDSKIRYIEGAENNLPDINAQEGASMIKELAENLTEEDLLLVLISGGGSALLPLPIPPITLDEKFTVIKKLGSKGANIRELNCLRKQISVLKGGGLAEVAYPCRIISLVLSDIVGDPLDFIASGPTIPNTDSPESAVEILKKYHLYEEIPDSIRRVLQRGNQFSDSAAPILNGCYQHVKNYIIGNNTIAAEAAKEEAINKGLQSVIVSTEIDGDVNRISGIYARMARNLDAAITDSGNKDKARVFLENAAMDLPFRHGIVEEILHLDFSRPICLIFAGEPTVVVRGGGKGGRNQQLALAFSVDVNNLGIKSADISFLSCGTDGIDGPTDAAGAIGSSDLVANALRENINPEYYLDNNDSYGFYERYNGGNNLVKIGHTGTNVMDIHVMVVNPKSLSNE
ncbi:glycerate kinase [Anoplophora glabripennis]|uniref:glycerate kinase n=1 Tax=Anoplophora glabripennis TaxID=217634 RepID=UPI000873B683|nr:glycerate kinase [Anoplophora glabripennis]